MSSTLLHVRVWKLFEHGVLGNLSHGICGKPRGWLQPKTIVLDFRVKKNRKFDNILTKKYDLGTTSPTLQRQRVQS